MSVFVRALMLVFALILAGPVGGGEDGGEQALIDQVTAALRKQTGAEPDAAAVVDALNRIMAKFYGDGRYAEAEQVARAALAEGERVLGVEHPQTLASVNNLAALYDSQGRYGDAEPLYRRALVARERVLGAEHPDTLGSVNNLAGLYKAQGRYGEAEPLFLRALAVNERTLGAEHPATLRSVNNLAALYDSQGRYGDAEPLYRRALAGYERVLGAEHPQTLTSVDNLAFLYKAQGRYTDAEPLYRRALAGFEKVLGAEHPDTLTSVNNLAGLYESQGRYGEAEPLLRRALAAREKVLGVEHPATLQSVNNLASLYESQGRYADAKPLFRRALAGYERVLGAEHPATLQSVNNLASLYESQGRYADAEPLFRRALAAREKVLGAEHPATLQSVNNLASLYESQGRYADAEPLFRRALAAREKVLGAEHPDTLRSVNNLAFLYKARGRYADAEPLLRRALEGSERQLGEAHPDTIQVRLNLAATLINLDRLAPALDQIRTLDGRLRTFVASQLDSTGSEQVRRQWLEKESWLQDVVFTLALAHPDSAAPPLAADILLRWKRLAGEQEAVLARLARTSQDSQVRDLARQVQQARADYSRLVNLPDPKPAQLAARKQARDQSLADLERLEVALRTRSRTFADQTAGQAATWQAVGQALPHGTALLDLRVFKPFDFKTGTFGDDRWLALVLEGDAGAGSDEKAKPPRLIDLGPVATSESDLQRIARLTDEDVCLARYLAKPAKRPSCAAGFDQANFAKPARAKTRAEAIATELDAVSARFYAALLGPLDRDLEGFETLYIAPDGALDLVPFARLKLPHGRYWIERQTLRQVRSGRDLIARAPVPAAHGLLALGAVDYDVAKSAQVTAPRPSDSAASPVLAAADADVSQASPRLRAACSAFPPLPGTAVELDYLKTHFDPNGGEVMILQGRDATKSRLKSHSPPPRILHLATHGCFIPRADPAERPMTLSLLALAGANRAATAKAGADQSDDGILHALEVLDLNLTGTELVTLSACDTGKGEVDRSEGVYGLVRAFQIAGAANVLMTLRPLNDDLAAEFVEDFYRNWLDRKPDLPADPASALRRTQLDWIGSGRPEKRDPRHWAPYVLVERR